MPWAPTPRQRDPVPVEIVEGRFEGCLAERLAGLGETSDIVLHWLGQAGFLITAGPIRVLIDPYLSDTLEEKYRGTATPHDRLMPAPITVDELPRIDLALATHHHTDHMDPGTLASLARAQPAVKFVVPAASYDEAQRRIGADPDRLLLMDAGEEIEPLPGLRITAIRAAHEDLARDEKGHYRFLGYGLTFSIGDQAAVTIVHSGDTILFEGQTEEVAAVHADLLLLPVNGRSARLKAHGIAGNLTLDEAIDLTARVGAGTMVAHHHGLFALNTRPLAEIERKAAEPGLPIRLIPARVGLELRVQVA